MSCVHICCCVISGLLEMHGVCMPITYRTVSIFYACEPPAHPSCPSSPDKRGALSSPFVLFFNSSITDVCEVMHCYHFGLHFLLFMFLFSPPAYEIFFCSCSVIFLLLFCCGRSLYSLYSLLLPGIAVEGDFPKPGMVALLSPTGTRSGASHFFFLYRFMWSVVGMASISALCRHRQKELNYIAKF